MATTRDGSVRSLCALALSALSVAQALLACEPPPAPAAPVAAASAPNTSREVPLQVQVAAPSCGAAWCADTGLPSQVTFSAVWGSAPNDVWLAGDQGTLLHWNGAAWAAAASGTSNSLRALSGTSAKDVWAAGLDGTLLHFDGASWSAARKDGKPWSPASGPNEHPIYCLLALPNQLLAGGAGVRTFDGAKWTEPHHGMLPTFALWGLDASSIWAVGAQGVVNRWDGQQWQRAGSENGPSFQGVWGTSANDVWVVGSVGSIVHWSGATPTTIASGTEKDLYAVRGFSDKDVWAVGDRGTILHWQGASWLAVPSPAPSALLSVWGSSADQVWIVGESGVVLRLGAHSG